MLSFLIKAGYNMLAHKALSYSLYFFQLQKYIIFIQISIY